MFRRRFAVFAAAAVLCLALLFLWRSFGPRPGAGTEPARTSGSSGPDAAGTSGAAKPNTGGTLTATMRGEPSTLNRFASSAFPTHLVSLLADARLVRIDPVTDEPQPWLAETVTRTPAAIDVTLRGGLRFSDGTPLTADDVVWSLKAGYATPGGGGIGDALRMAGREMSARAESPTRVVFTLPGPWAPAVRVLEALPILPRAVVEPALAAGTFLKACPVTAPCPGLGPFVVSRYEAGQRVVLARNPHYWRTDAAGTRLPYLDGLTLEIVPDQNAELLRLSSGQADLQQSELRAEDYRALRPDADAGRVILTDVGPGLDRQMLWFNLGPAPIDEARWFVRQDAFRQAVSLAVDRRGFADTVFLGAADPSPEPVPAANRTWTAAELPRPSYDPRRAAALLEGLGLADRDNDGVREDASGRPARFSVLVQAGITSARTGMEFLRDALANVGVGLDIVALDLGGVMTQFQKGQYDAIYHHIQASDTDPTASMDFWRSSGSSHLWHPRQAAPATPWEAEIDRRIEAVGSTMDPGARAREFAAVQRLMLEHNPVLWFAAPRVIVATRPRVGGVTPKLTRPQVLWKADELFVRSP